MMSTLLLMKLFEGAPSRYDRGIRLLTRGRLDSLYDRLTANVEKGNRVLDIGCGTGALALRAAKKGAAVKAMDIDPGMLEVARVKAKNVQAKVASSMPEAQRYLGLILSESFPGNGVRIKYVIEYTRRTNPALLAFRPLTIVK